jgi:pimeloyl-ACP methyl ester carboxylesterase
MDKVRTRHLQVEVSINGPQDGPPVVLLHGWPDDATTWARVSPQLNKAGFKTIALMHRGFGGTRFLSRQSRRTGNVGILALDAIDLMDALGHRTFFVAGHDWGSNIAEALALGWPQRVPAIAMLSTPSRLGGLKTPPFDIARLYWYHWFQSTKRGAEAVAKDPKGFAHIMWETWSPAGWFKEKTFNDVAKSFTGKDWVPITLHSYRSRWGEAPLDPRSRALEDKIKNTKRLKTPTLFFHGARDGVTPHHMTQNMAEKFTGPFERIVLDGMGHFPTREAPAIVASGLVRHFSHVSAQMGDTGADEVRRDGTW